MATRTLAAVLAPAMMLGGTFFAAPQTAEAASKATCRVHAVLASKEGDGKLPKNLEFLRSTLEDDQFAAYKSFHLVDKKTLKLDGDKQGGARFSSGHKIGLKLMETKPKLKLHLELTGRDGKKNLVKTNFSIENNGEMMVAAGKYKKGEVSGKVFFHIHCKS